MNRSELSEVFDVYPDDCRPRQIEFLGGGGGFSGARLWKCESARGTLCLRRWPLEHPSQTRLEFIQAVLWHVQQEGFLKVPLPLETRAHRGYVWYSDHLWEITPWMPGEANYLAQPNRAKLAAALTALAMFHRAAESFPLPEPARAQVPAVQQRLQAFDDWTTSDLRTVSAGIARGDHPQTDPAAQAILLLFEKTSAAERQSVAAHWQRELPLQPCIRDIWDQHVLFEGDEVRALIDFGSLNVDHVSTDLARLLGSMARDDEKAWQAGFAAYDAIRPLSEGEKTLARVLDRAGVLLSGMNWLRWIYLNNRHFDDWAAVSGRLELILLRAGTV